MNRFILLLVLLLSFTSTYSQTPTPGVTVGMLWNNVDDMQEGYLLYSPTGTNNAFLIDECGLKVNEWNFGQAYNFTGTYLNESGSIYKYVYNILPGQTQSHYGDGCIEVRDWNDNLEWLYCSEDEYRGMHSDLHELPNGNYLALVQTVHTYAEILLLGINPSDLSSGNYETESIIEVQPTGPDSGTIVWEWHLFDHLVQDYDSTVTETYGVISEYPERYEMGLESSFVHFNSIDYSPELDIIVVSSWRNDEVFMIDHSTTSEEAEGRTGGNFGMGGDLIYRWGKPSNYLTGGSQKLSGQHNPRFVEEGPWVGSISVFNNEYGSISSTSGSAACIFTPVLDTMNFTFQKGSTGAYLPNDFDFVWSGDVFPGDDMYSGIESGVDFLANGNFVVCEATSGRFTEVDQNGDVVWIYQSPFNGASPISQGAQPGYFAEVYKVEKYGTDYPAFTGLTFSPTGPVENENVLSINCGIDPYGIPNNVSLQSINNAFSGACANSISPEITVWNFGSNAISEMEVEYSVNGGSVSAYSWEGTAFGFQDEVTFTLPEIFFIPLASNEINITVISINGLSDDDPGNNSSTETFMTAVESLQGLHQISVLTDNWGDEVKVEIIDDSGTVLYSQDGFADNTSTIEQIDIQQDGCYSFNVYDSYSDGLEAPGFVQLNGPDGAVVSYVSGAYSFVSEQFTINSNPIEAPVSSFTFLQDEQTLDFQNNSTGDALSYYWDFGNGMNSDLENPIGIFFEPGLYEVCLIAVNISGSDTSCTSISIYATAINEIASLGIKVYPNPTENENLHIHVENSHDDGLIEILSIDGKTMYSESLSSLEQSKSILNIDVAKLTPGTYLVRYSDTSKSYLTKVLIGHK